MKSAVCLFVRDEERDIAEWLAWQFAIGFDACLIYENGSIDRTAEIARHAGRTHDVRLIAWDNAEKRAQGLAYCDVMQRFGHEFDWIACIDSDELIVPATDIPTLLNDRAEHAAIALNWRCFGSSGYIDRPDGLMSETFIRRAPDTFAANRGVKSIVRPAAFEKTLSPHRFALKSGSYAMASGRPVEWINAGQATADFDGGCIHHYFTRSQSEWDRKLARGYRDGTQRDAVKAFAAYDRNEIEDRSALRFSAAVREIMAHRMPLPELASVP